MATEKPKRYKPPGIYQIPAELIKAGGRTIHSRVSGENYVMGNLMFCTHQLFVMK